MLVYEVVRMPKHLTIPNTVFQCRLFPTVRLETPLWSPSVYDVNVNFRYKIRCLLSCLHCVSARRRDRCLHRFYPGGHNPPQSRGHVCALHAVVPFCSLQMKIEHRLWTMNMLSAAKKGTSVQLCSDTSSIRAFMIHPSCRYVHLRRQVRGALEENFKDFEVVEFVGNGTMLSQLQTFATASVIVAPHGAGLSNMVVSPPHTPVLEIGPPE